MRKYFAHIGRAKSSLRVSLFPWLSTWTVVSEVKLHRRSANIEEIHSGTSGSRNPSRGHARPLRFPRPVPPPDHYRKVLGASLGQSWTTNSPYPRSRLFMCCKKFHWVTILNKNEHFLFLFQRIKVDRMKMSGGKSIKKTKHPLENR